MGWVTFNEPGGPGKPQVRLLDARAAGLDDAALHDWARSLTPPPGARYVTRSYCHPYALVSWHSEPVGVDIERIAPCDAAFADLICTPAERSDPAWRADPDRYLTSLWSSKEALSKALGDALRYEPSRLDSPSRWPRRRSGRWEAAQLIVAPDHVAWLCWRSTVPAHDARPRVGSSDRFDRPPSEHPSSGTFSPTGRTRTGVPRLESLGRP
jgi:hypothetical protein